MDDRTAAALKDIVFTAFFVTWIALAILGSVTSRRMDAATKRKWMPRGVILVGTLFVFFATTLTFLESRTWSSLNILFVVVPAVVLISYANLKFTKICSKCAATQYNANWFTPQRFCSKCGAELEPVKISSDDRFLE
jgi:hypothetical protein